MMGELIGFKVPEWMIKKMKSQMQSLRTDVGKSAVRPKTLETKPLNSDLKLPFSSSFYQTNSNQVSLDFTVLPL
jgi:hypothetical protein